MRRPWWCEGRRAVVLAVLALAVVLMHAGPAGACVEGAAPSADAAAGVHHAVSGDAGDHGGHGCPGTGTTGRRCLSDAAQTGVVVAGPTAMGLPAGNDERLGHHAVDGALASMTRSAHGPRGLLDLVADLCVNRV